MGEDSEKPVLLLRITAPFWSDQPLERKPRQYTFELVCKVQLKSKRGFGDRQDSTCRGETSRKGKTCGGDVQDPLLCRSSLTTAMEREATSCPAGVTASLEKSSTS